MKTLSINGYTSLFDKEELLLTKEGQQILKTTRDKSLGFNCLCKGIKNPLSMHVRRLGPADNYYYTIVRNKGTMDKHNKSCTNYGTPEIRKEYESTNKDKKPRLLSIDTNSHLKKEEGNFSDKNNLEMYSMGENIIYYAWLSYIYKYGETPNIEKLFKTIYENDYKHKLGNENISLSKLIFKPFGNLRYENINDRLKKAYYRIYKDSGEKHNMYILGEVVDIQKYKDDVNSVLKIVEPQKKNYFNLIVNTFFLEKRLKNIPSKSKMLISCFVADTFKAYLEVGTFTILPFVKDIGLSVERNSEIDFINHLIENKILFTKPPITINYYKDVFGQEFNPQFVLLDLENRKDATIAEIYGYGNKYSENKEFVKKYWDVINSRIEFFKGLVEYNYFYWLYHKNPLPTIYSPKKR